MKRHLIFWLCVLACILFLIRPEKHANGYGHRTLHHRQMHRYGGAQ